MQHSGCQNKKVCDLQNCQKEGEGQSEGSFFSLFVISFYQVVLAWRSRWHRHSWRHSSLSPVCKYRIKYCHYTKRIALFN